MARKKSSSNTGMTVGEAGRRGGEATKKRYGSEHYAAIGQKGGEAVRDKYGAEFFSEIGQKGGEARKGELGPEGYSALGREGGRQKGERRKDAATLAETGAGEVP